MPTQVQGLITPTYDAVVEVPATGEVVTESALTNTAVALGNRIEFVRQLTPQATDAPEFFLLIREEFLSALDSVGPSTLTADYLWRRSSTNSPSINHSAGSAKNPGQLICAMPSASIYQFQLGVSGGDLTDFSKFEELTVVLKVEDDPGNTAVDAFVVFGLAADNSFLFNTNDLKVVYSRVNSLVDWSVVAYKAGVPTISFVSIGALAQDEFETVKFKRLPATGDVEVYFNGSLALTIAAVDVPVGACTLGGLITGGTGDAVPMVATFDLISFRGECGNRRGA